MSNMVLCYRNILETGTVNVTSENTSFPKYRLYNRDIEKSFKGDSIPANFYITNDQGSTIYEVNRLLIPSDHNLAGLALKLQYSTDNFATDINDAVSWTQSGSDLINKTFTAQTKRYWRLNVVAPTIAPELMEMYLTKDYTFAQNVAYGFQEGKYRVISRRETGSRRLRTRKYGEAKYHWNYRINFFLNGQKAEFEAWENHCEGIKPVFIMNHDDVWAFVEILNEIEYIPVSNSLWLTGLELMEIKRFPGVVKKYIVTEAGERIITEGGDRIITE